MIHCVSPPPIFSEPPPPFFKKGGGGAHPAMGGGGGVWGEESAMRDALHLPICSTYLRCRVNLGGQISEIHHLHFFQLTLGQKFDIFFIFFLSTKNILKTCVRIKATALEHFQHCSRAFWSKISRFPKNNFFKKYMKIFFFWKNHDFWCKFSDHRHFTKVGERL